MGVLLCGDTRGGQIDLKFISLFFFRCDIIISSYSKNIKGYSTQNMTLPVFIGNVVEHKQSKTDVFISQEKVFIMLIKKPKRHPCRGVFTVGK